jgi:L-lactate dehydrogenase (cytochrome)
VTIENMSAQFDPSVTWADVEAIRAQWPGRLLVKGPLGPDDARRALAAGADGVHLSNHGGRQLDRIATPIDTLAAVRAALGDDATIVVDSGLRSGADLAVAVALGADAGAVGRAYLYGLMAAGQAGVEHALALLAAQFRRTLALLGVASVGELRGAAPQLLRHRAMHTIL